jgi:phage-related protein
MTKDKPLVWLNGEIKTPPFGEKARREAGFFLRMVQRGREVCNPPFYPMPEIGKSCYDLHIKDLDKTWRIIIFVDNDCIVILEVFAKKSQKTPKKVKKVCKERLKRYFEII